MNQPLSFFPARPLQSRGATSPGTVEKATDQEEFDDQFAEALDLTMNSPAAEENSSLQDEKTPGLIPQEDSRDHEPAAAVQVETGASAPTTTISMAPTAQPLMMIGEGVEGTPHSDSGFNANETTPLPSPAEAKSAPIQTQAPSLTRTEPRPESLETSVPHKDTAPPAPADGQGQVKQATPLLEGNHYLAATDDRILETLREARQLLQAQGGPRLTGADEAVKARDDLRSPEFEPVSRNPVAPPMEGKTPDRASTQEGQQSSNHGLEQPLPAQDAQKRPAGINGTITASTEVPATGTQHVTAPKAGPGTAEALPADRIFSQIQKAFGETPAQAQRPVRTLTVHLEPPELGRLQVRLQMVEGHLKALITTEQKQVTDLLKGDLPRLIATLDKAGIVPTTVEVKTDLAEDNPFHRHLDREGQGAASQHEGEPGQSPSEGRATPLEQAGLERTETVRPSTIAAGHVDVVV